YIRPSFEELERAEARQDLDRVIAAVDREAEHLATTVRDWSQWDDTYDYVGGLNPDFVDDLGPDGFHTLKADLVAIYGPDSVLRFSGRLDRGSGTVIPDPDFPKRAPPSAPYLVKTTEASGISGLLSRTGGCYLIASGPILRNDGSGSLRGSLIMGRIVDDAFSASIAAQTGVRAVLGSPQDLPKGIDLATIAAHGMRYARAAKGEPDVHGYGLISDISGQPILLVRTETARAIGAWTERTIRISGAMLLVIGGAICLLIYAMLLRLVISPLSTIGERLGGSQAAPSSLPLGLLERRDEIGRLAQTLQQMAAALGVRDRALRMANERLETRIEERTRELRKASDELRLMGKVVESTSEAIVITDLGGNILLVNEAFCRQSGYRPEEVIGRNPRLLKSGRHGVQYFRELWDRLAAEGSWAGEIWNRTKGGDIHPEWLTINLIRGEDGEPRCYVGVSTDISLMKDTEDKLNRLAYYDPLTGLPNRALFKDRLERAILQAERYGHRVALLMIDLDRFKFVNDALGHEAGDRLLIEVARRIAQRVRASDTVCRLGGDEFTVILDRIGRSEHASIVARGIITELGSPFALKEREVFIGASIGISVYPSDDEASEGLTRKADAAMYQAKAAGRNTYRFASGETEATSQTRIALESELRRAVERGEFHLVFQPIVDLAGNRVLGAEALVRWRRGDGKLELPGDFIPLAEETGIIVQLGDWILRAACSAAAAWRDLGLPMYVSVNISPRQFEQPGLALRIETALAEAGLEPELLAVEITESAIMRDVELALHTMSALKELGIRLAIDDFGTGYSSLSYLSRFPIDKLKIDQSFTRGIEESASTASIVNAVIAMAESLGIGTIAEGIETEGQRDYLERRGCGEGQGYLFSEPIDAGAFAALGLRALRAVPPREGACGQSS
ncbi:MAG TPA: EAL domain-containing protein, partial [Rectinemataceae bacterium]|nr:EAL domain-containing protein [Rectinemataceae bacterium]